MVAVEELSQSLEYLQSAQNGASTDCIEQVRGCDSLFFFFKHCGPIVSRQTELKSFYFKSMGLASFWSFDVSVVSAGVVGFHVSWSLIQNKAPYTEFSIAF